MEKFKEVYGYPDYLISNKGRVKTKSRKVKYNHSVTKTVHYRVTTERFLKVYENGRTGYKFIQPRLNGNAKNKTIHRLVAETFIKKEDGKDYVNHKDGNKHNNCVKNLEWVTNKYNHEHATQNGLKAKGVEVNTSKLNDKCVIAIKKLIKLGWSDTDIANLFDISRPTINLIKNNKTWKHIALTNEELTKKLK